MDAVRKGGILFAALLILGGTITLIWLQYGYVFASASQFNEPLPEARTVSNNESTSAPIRLAITSLGIDLPVNPGTYNEISQEWTLSDDSLFVNAYTADGLIGLDQPVTPLIYGHNKPHILAKTKTMTTADILSVVLEDGYRVDYTFVKRQQLSPTDDWILNYTGPEDLLLMTCDGAWDQHRTILYFERVS